MTAAPVTVSHVAPAGECRSIRGSDPECRQRQRGDRREGVRRRRDDVRPDVPPSSVVDRHNVLVCSTGLIGIPLPIDLISAAIPALVAARTPEGSSTRPRPFARPTRIARRSRSGQRLRGRAGWPRVRRCSLPTWRRCSRCSPPTPRHPAELQAALQAGVADSFNVSDDRRVHVDERHRPAAGQRSAGAGRPRRSHRGGRRRVRRPGPSQMAGDAEGATKVVQPRRHRGPLGRRRRDGRSQGGGESAGEVLVVRQGPVLGSDRERARQCGRRHFDQRLLSICYGGIDGVRTVVSRSITIAPRSPTHMAQRHLEIAATSVSARVVGRC